MALWASYTGLAHHESEENGLSRDADMVMEIIGKIADGDFYNGPAEDKIRLAAALLRRIEEK
jgi:hypothetical protein